MSYLSSSRSTSRKTGDSNPDPRGPSPVFEAGATTRVTSPSMVTSRITARLRGRCRTRTRSLAGPVLCSKQAWRLATSPSIALIALVERCIDRGWCRNRTRPSRAVLSSRPVWLLATAPSNARVIDTLYSPADGVGIEPGPRGQSGLADRPGATASSPSKKLICAAVEGVEPRVRSRVRTDREPA